LVEISVRTRTYSNPSNIQLHCLEGYPLVCDWFKFRFLAIHNLGLQVREFCIPSLDPEASTHFI